MSEEEQHQLRVGKVEALRRRGVDPYPVGFRRTHAAGELHDRFGDLAPESATGERVTVAGRLVGLRDIGKLCFGVLTDWSGRIQLFADVDGLDDRYPEFVDLDLGDWVGASGEVITTRKGELSVRVEDFTLLAKSLHPLPEKWHGLSEVEVRYRRRYLDLIANADSRRIARTRSTVMSSVRRSMEARGFVEVEGPVLQLSAGGALARPFMTHHNALDIDMYLRIALELHLKRLTVGGIDKVFEMGRVFRNEGVSPMHNPEFTMLESYEAFADYHQVMELTEQVLAEAAEAVHGSTAFEYQGRRLDLAPPWERRSLTDEVEARWGITVDTPFTESRRRAAGIGVEVEVGGTGKVIEELFERFIQPELWDPVFFVDYPLEVSPLAREHREGGGIAERFEAFIAGLELANGYSELNDPAEQRRRFTDQAAARAQGDAEAHPVDEDYIQALEYGLPPTGGLGIGMDRTVMLLADVTSVREVILFPHLRPEGA